ncbi:nucleotidyltransferase domain-containing protein [Saccharospirillum sp.]|uniref:nucleotidyltransferase domain-containing protein n=1 Tax=Saccharospirillum sp. TaxID=2033801 RepID=UPI0034A0836F
MRLTSQQIQTIKTLVSEVFGAEVRVHLFGSRLDDSKKGGDIDLLIQSDQVIDHKLRKTASLAARLQLSLDEQKFDVVVKDAQTADTPFYQEVSRTAALL